MKIFSRVVALTLLAILVSQVVSSQDLGDNDAKGLLEKTKYNKDRGNLEAARGYGMLGLDQAENVNDQQLVVEFKTLLGDIYYTKREFKKAIADYYHVLHYGEKTGSVTYKISGYSSLANTYSSMGAYNKAGDYYKRVLELYERQKEPKGRAVILSSLAFNYAISYQTKQAITSYEKLLLLASSSGQPEYISKAHQMLFEQYARNDQPEKAIQYGELYFKKIKDGGDDKAIAVASHLLALQYLKVNRDKDALNSAQLASKNSPTETEYKSTVGVALAKTGNYSRSMDAFNQAIDQYERKRQTSMIADVYNKMAFVTFQKKDYRATINYLENAKNIAKSRNAREILMETYRLFSLVHERKGSLALASDYKKQYNSLKTQLDSQGKYSNKISPSMENLAESYEQQAKAQLSEFENQRLAEEQEKLKSEKKIKELEFIEQQNKLKDIEIEQRALEAERVKQELLISKQNNEALAREKELDQLATEAKLIRLKEEETERKLEMAKQNEEILKKQKEFEEREAKQAKLIQYVIIIASVLIFAALGFAFYRAINTNKTISEQNQNLAEQQKIILNRNIQLKKSSEAMLAMNNKLKKAHLNLKLLLEKEQQTKKELEKANQEIKNTQVHLVQAEKMSSLGLLTAGIAHEINNPINFVSSGAQSLLQNFEELNIFIANYQKVLSLDDIVEIKKYASMLQEDEDALNELQSSSEELLEDVNYGITRITEIVNGLRSFSRHDEAEIKDANMNESFKAALLILKNKSKNKAEMVLDLDDQLPQIQCFPGQLNQVFVNLINNALDAIEGLGQITISTKDLDENYIEIRVGDNGSGMPDEIKDKIFDPFFTTKDIGKGTGLGLSISHGIIEKHNGEIRVESEMEVGTTFIIKLPKKLELDDKVLEDQLV